MCSGDRSEYGIGGEEREATQGRVHDVVVPGTVEAVHTVPAKEKPKRCKHCGRRHDDESAFKFKDATSHKCGLAGHIAPVCRQSSPPPRQPAKKTGRWSGRRRKKATKWFGVDSTMREDAAPLFALAGDSTEPPILVGLVVNNKAVQIELDTGASMFVMSEAVYWQLFPESKLQKPSADLKT